MLNLLIIETTSELVKLVNKEIRVYKNNTLEELKELYNEIKEYILV
ncbi:hypothetical protein HMPREF0216_01903 [Clostridium celatum DSM 1785]|uniref:Uncharacterized protein n=1 Tax=Clostridium celatum DSM 1785 TaxID=545697 RepID=L1QFF5_9CLOT|nr:hypothetical protein HMPREF0216_01903 [Clostridium celatum DSM 1785]